MRVGRYRWVEMKLFEALGGWVTSVPELEVKLRLATHAHHHAFHAELWHKRLPELRGTDPDRLTAPAPGMDAFMAAMTEPEGAGQTIEKLVGAYRVLVPHAIAAYTYHLENTSEVADASTVRVLKLVLRDELEDWRDGEVAIQRLLGDDEEIERAAARQVRLEKLMLAAGGIAGPRTDGAVV